jgi:hypothetical protein
MNITLLAKKGGIGKSTLSLLQYEGVPSTSVFQEAGRRQSRTEAFS